MKYGFMPKLMWTVYKGTFKKQLTETFREDPNAVMAAAHKKYKEILADVRLIGRRLMNKNVNRIRNRSV